MDLTVHAPARLWSWATVGVPVVSVLGGAWLLLWVSNVKVPRAALRAILGLVTLSLLAAGAWQLASPAVTTLTLKASQISALNPLMVMVIIPGLNVAVWRPLERRAITVKPLQKMTAGMFLTALAFVLAAVLQQRVQADPNHVSVLWQVPQYLVVTTAEVLVSVTGLEFAYTQAPRTMKSTIMGFWLLCVTIGNLLVAFLAPLERKYPLSSFFLLFAGLMAAAAAVFAVLAARYRGRTWLQG
jgi:dipeptide/tripeptide permease